MDIKTIGELAAPVLTGVAGYLKGVKGLEPRIRKLEGHVSNILSAIEALKAGFRLDLDTLRNDVDELREDLKAWKDRFDDFRDASGTDFAKEAELARFIEKQGEAWQSIQRTLGRIEGIVDHWEKTRR